MLPSVPIACAARLVAGAAVVCFAVGCGAEAPPSRPTPVTPAVSVDSASLAAPPPYAFDAPVWSAELDGDLDEISGLALLDDEFVAAVQDEDGEIYILSLATGAVERIVDFGKDGDYEGIERVGDRLWVLRSDGDLYEVIGWQDADEVDADKIETILSSSCDAEGLGYDRAGARLLIACKESAGDGLAGYKAVYAFDLATREIEDEPAFLIAVDTFSDHVADDVAFNDAVRDALGPLGGGLSGFKPSAVAVHPETGEIYLLSSAKTAVLVLTPDGTLRHAWPLPGDALPQPEGLAILPSGDLLIATEGVGGPARLFRFARRSDS